MRRTFASLAMLILAAMSACTDLPDVARGTCGNGVVDDGEDCDSFAPSGQACRASGAVGQCRLDCSQEGHACPSGWGCGTDGVCRQPTGRFVEQAVAADSGGARLTPGDFDGDGRADVLSLAPGDVFGTGTARVHFFDEAGRVEQTVLLGKPIAKPVVHDISGDGRPDIVAVMSISAIETFLGSSGRTFNAVPYPSLPIPLGTTVVLTICDALPLDAMGNNAGDELVVAVQDAKGVSIALDDKVLTSLPNAKLENLVRPTVRARFDETSPCESLVLAETGGKAVTVLTPCTKAGTLAFTNNTTVLDFPAASVTGLAVGDVNSDGHVDVMVGTANAVHIGFGDGKGAFFATTDLKGPSPATAPVLTPTVQPIGGGDLDGDGKFDLVTQEGIFLSSIQGNQKFVVSNLGRPWTQAILADFDGSGTLDVMLAAAGAPGLTLVLSDGKGGLTESTIPTLHAVTTMVKGDFDANLVPDVAIGTAGVHDQSDAADNTPDAVEIVFGEKGKVPQGTVKLGDFGKLFALDTGRAEGGSPDGATDLAVSWYDDDRPEQLKIAVAFGSADRYLVAPFLLQTPSGIQALPMGLTVGRFGGDERADLAAVASTFEMGDTSGQKSKANLWIAQSAGGGDFAPPMPSDQLAVNPVVDLFAQGVGGVPTVAGDLDANGTDEIVVLYAKPGAKETRVFVFTPTDGKATLSTELTLATQVERTSTPLLFDVDGDGKLDLVVLTGNPRDAREVVVAWGTGGSFDANVTTLAPPGHPLGGLAAHRDASGTHLYVAGTKRVYDIQAKGRDLGFDALGYTDGGTDVTVADVTGDGVVDLLVIDEGILRVHVGKAVLP